MAHALAAFIREQMDERSLRNRDVVRESGLSRALVSKYANDRRDALTQLPERTTIEGFAKAFGVSFEFLFGKAIESLGLGYTSGDFVNSVATASDRQLLDEIGERLLKRGEGHAGSSAPIEPPTPIRPAPAVTKKAARPGVSQAEREAAAEEAMRRKVNPAQSPEDENRGGGEDSA